MSFTVVPDDPARQLADPGPPEACPHCGRRACWRNGLLRAPSAPAGPLPRAVLRCQSCWVLREPRQPVAGRAAAAGGGPLGLGGATARGGPGGRDLAAAGGPATAGGRGPGPRGPALRPAPHGAGFRLDGLFPGTGGPRRAHPGHRRRPGLPQGPEGLRAGPAAVRRAHAAHRAPTAAPHVPGPGQNPAVPRGCGRAAAAAGTAPVGAANCCWSAASGPTRARCGCRRPCWPWWNTSWTAGTTSCAACATPPSPPARTGWRAGSGASRPGRGWPAA